MMMEGMKLRRNDSRNDGESQWQVWMTNQLLVPAFLFSLHHDYIWALHSQSQVGRLPAWVSQMKSLSFAKEIFKESQHCCR
jgi:hypothetical protein